MESTVKKPVTVMRSEHHFTCDYCGKHIGTSLELEDGYYQALGEYSQSMVVDNEKYVLIRTVCEDCRKTINSALLDALKDLGFKKDES